MGYNFNIMSNRVSVHIDGGNFYHLVLKKLKMEENDFDFDKFIEFLVDGRILVDRGKRYYVGTVREKVGDPRSVDAMSKQTRLFTTLKAGKWEIKTSKLRERQEKIHVDNRVEDFQKILKCGIKTIKYTKNREKGIDVKIVTDLFMGAIDDQYDIAIVVSSDSDLVPAIDSLRMRLKKKVEYVGFSIVDPIDANNSTGPTLSLIRGSDIQRILVESDLERFKKLKLI
jgi:uncharacterized LabA/DUF88 family protein